LMNTMSRKMLGYALGRTVLASDRPLIADMAAAGLQAPFADLALKIVNSRQFRTRAGDEPAASPLTTASKSRPSQLSAGIQ
jgi:hypothetical protein